MAKASIGSDEGWSPKRKSRRRETTRRQSTPIQPALPLLGQVIDESGDTKNLDMGLDVFSDFRSELRDREVLRLIDTICKDDVNQFNSYNFKQTESLTMNVELTDLPVSKGYSMYFCQFSR